MRLEQVVLIGAGNVGWQLGRRLKEKKIKVVQVFSRQLDNAQALAKKLEAGATDDLKQLAVRDHCLYLLAVKDDLIGNIAAQLDYLSGPNRALAHTSGAVSAQVLAGHFEHFGVFYPLQTLSKDRKIDFGKVPICVFSPNQSVQEALKLLANRISEKVSVIDDEQRKILHIAAVFVNNFSNHLFAVGKEITESEGLSFELLRPLIAETAAKVMDQSPMDMQTGPAKRQDQQTILGHLRYLQKYPEFQDLYRVISHSLQEMHNKTI